MKMTNQKQSNDHFAFFLRTLKGAALQGENHNL